MVLYCIIVSVSKLISSTFIEQSMAVKLYLLRSVIYEYYLYTTNTNKY